MYSCIPNPGTAVCVFIGCHLYRDAKAMDTLIYQTHSCWICSTSDIVRQTIYSTVKFLLQKLFRSKLLVKNTCLGQYRLMKIEIFVILLFCSQAIQIGHFLLFYFLLNTFSWWNVVSLCACRK